MNDVEHYDGLEFWGPMDSARANRLIELMRLEPGAHVLDIGCGKGEILLRIANRFGARVTGVEKSPHALALARAAFADRAPDAAAEFLELDIQNGEAPPGPFDATIWLGGPYLQTSFAETVQTLAAWTKPGGVVLIGHGFWMQSPPAPYLDAMGFERDELLDHSGNLELAAEHGLRVLYSCVSTRREWDDFEGMIHANFERYAMLHPENPDPRDRLERDRRSFAAQQRWGRETMGFGFYLYAVEPRS